MKRRILYIGHDASRTGAPMVLLHYLQWLRSRDPAAEIDLLLLTDGPLTDAYRSVANVFVLNPRRSFPGRVIGRLRRMILPQAAFKPPNSLKFTNRYGTVVGNTILTLEALEHFKKQGTRTICWVHEMPYVIKVFYETDRFVELIDKVDRLIVGSNAVAKALIGFGMEKPTDVVYEFLPSNKTKAASGIMRADFGIPGDAFLVLGCGHFGWRKGIDIFLKVADNLVNKYPDIYFVWIGGKGRGRNEYHEQVMAEHERLASKEKIIFTGELADIDKLFAETDVFTLTSREDPFPLVCLLAADKKKPVICFEGAGGMPEFVGSDAGSVVPFEDADAFATTIEEFYLDREKLGQAGKAAKAKLLGEFSMERSCAKINEILNA